MKIKINKILLITVGILILIIFPYTREVDIFRANDINWKTLKQAKKVNQFNPETFTFSRSYEFTEGILKLNGSQILIKGFFQKHKHGDHIDLSITESVTDVCFMCDHDEHYNIIKLKSFENSSLFLTLKDEALIEISGVFFLNKKDKEEPIFQMKNVVLEQIIN